MTMFARLWAPVAASALACACDGGGAANAGAVLPDLAGSEASGPGADTLGAPDATTVDAGAVLDGLVTFDVVLTDSAVDAPTLDLSATKPACNLAAPSPGECGSPCSADNQCAIGYCTPTRDQKVCSGLCGGNLQCPEGWGCMQVAGAPDTVFGCLPLAPNLGRPCMGDFDCKTQVGEAPIGIGDVCVPAGEEGAFCGADCAKTDKCPAGFSCKPVKSVDGKPAKQCVAEKLNDNCTDRFENEKAETKCSKSGKDGACTGKRHCQSKQLTPCTAKTPAGEVCNAQDDDCDGQTDEPAAGATCKIVAGDSSCPGTPICVGGIETCVGQKPVPELCNNADDDCDGQTDEGCDDDKDGYCDAALGYEPAGKVACPKGGGDCDDKDAGKHPSAKELCNGADDNCNGLKDAEDPLLLIHDSQPCEKQQGVCAGSKKPALLCQTGQWLACADQDYTLQAPSYSKVEVCDDKDNDCSGKADDGCNDDGDGYCDAGMATLGFPLVCPKGGGDCNDDDKLSLPGAVEKCDDLDQNCNGAIDEGCDDDKDGQCDGELTVVGTPKSCPSGEGDCDDLNPKRFKGAKELCNGVDDNCTGGTDELFPNLGKSCTDGKGICNVAGTVVCAPDGSASVCSTSAGKPQSEICDNLDNDCDGDVDEGCDDDKDGYCDSAMATAGKPKVCPLGGGDCNDLFGDQYPSAKETCNGKDDDCDGKTDASDGDLIIEDPQNCEKNLGVCKGSKKPVSLCANGAWLPCSAEHYANWNANYATQEACDNLDNDCSGLVDEGCDDDGDGFCNKNLKVIGFSPKCSKGVGDCQDKDPDVHPLATELCDNKDNDCNLKIDDGCDKDSDNYCDAGKTIPFGVTPQICPAGGGDCNDDDFKVNPGVKDFCADFMDNNCNGQTDDGCPPTINGFVGQLGPDFKATGWLQCAGYYDTATGEDIPTGWGLDCADKAFTKVRVACGAGKLASQVRYIDAKKNVFAYGLVNMAESGLIYDSNFNLEGNNLIKADAENPALARSWWVSAAGCSESIASLTVNNNSCAFEASNCFGQGIIGPRYLFVYVAK
ncbi:MAG: putative metal-binding motif-containing protein [Deltaproteobacteria bacterium]|nr:putative metal-binding motif-containing protein [Deltaproteobacteria bacterium]